MIVLTDIRALLIALIVCATAGCGGNSSDAAGGSTATIAGAPTITSVTAGNASAVLSFSAPTSNGGAVITSYTATCTTGSNATSASGSASPITVSGLTNGLTYACRVTATNAAGTGSASASVDVTPAVASPTGTASTAGTDCSYSESTFNSSASVNATSTATWSCGGGKRSLTANGLPDHPVGTFPNTNNPNTISAQSVSWYTTTSPAQNTGSTAVTPTGYALNGVKFDPGTAGTCPSTATSKGSCSLIGSTGSWNIEALGPSVSSPTFDFGTDSNNAHVQPNGAYHYHGMPEGILTANGVTTQSPRMLLVGWAQDGFPIYARFGHGTALDATSPLKVMTSSYQIKTMLDSGRPSTSIIPAGTFSEDWEYVAGIGDLDACNGRFGVTPEFPNGIYHYYITDTYPYIQRCTSGTPQDPGEPGGAPQ